LVQSQILSKLKMGEGKLPVCYLRVPLISSWLCVADCDTHLEKIIFFEKVNILRKRKGVQPLVH
jgi:hypothetical protein